MIHLRIWTNQQHFLEGSSSSYKNQVFFKSAGCNSWKSGNLYGFRFKSSLSISLVKLYEISTTCDKCLIDSDGSFEMTILSFDMAFFLFWLGSLFFRIILWTEPVLSNFLMIAVIVDLFRAYLDLYFVLQALWTRTGLPNIAYF